MYLINGKECLLNFVTDAPRFAEKNPSYIPPLQAARDFQKFVDDVGHKRGPKAWGRTIAKVDPRIFEMAMELEPDLLLNDAKWNRWIDAHPEWKIK